MEPRSSYVDLPQELDDYIKETINHSVGLPVSTQTLQLKLQASEQSRRNIQDQYFSMRSRLQERDLALTQARNEASMSAQALKKFVEENQRLAEECTKLLDEVSRLENECSLYEHDRDALMEFANEVEDRAKQAEVHVLEVNDELGRVSKELEFYKKECDKQRGNEARLNEELQLLNERISTIENLRLQGCSDNQLDCSQCSPPKTDEIGQSSHVLHTTPEDLSPVGATTLEEHLLHSLVDSMFDKDGRAATAHTFLEENSEVESCRRLLMMWDRLTPASQNIVSLVAVVKALQNDKEHLRINLARAEEEVKVLFEENTIIEEEKNKLLKLYSREKHHHGSGGKHTNSSSAKSNKRKSSPRVSCSAVGMMDLDTYDAPRPPLSPLQHNSPESRMHKK